jgi:thiol-disulfide isomerase/thioredoxin
MGPAQTKQRTNAWLNAALVLALLSFASGCGTANSSSARDTSEQTAPAVSFQTLDGRTVSLADYRGKVVLLNFWGTWCNVCRSEIPELIALQQQYGGKDFTILGVAMRDEQSTVAAFVAKPQFNIGGRMTAMNYPVVMGSLQLESTFGGFIGYPNTFIISKDGKIVAKAVGIIDAESTRQLIQKLL